MPDSRSLLHQTGCASCQQLRQALHETIDLCNAMREHAPTLSLAGERRLRDALKLAQGKPLPAHIHTFGEWNFDPRGHERTCQTCGFVERA
jgi:hypothetical protein